MRFKRGIKNILLTLIDQGVVLPSCSEDLHIFMDEHSTATDGRYELKEAIEAEIKIGTWNYAWNIFYAPVLPSLGQVEVNFVDSRSMSLVRAADIVANRVYYKSCNNELEDIESKVTILRLP